MRIYLRVLRHCHLLLLLLLHISRYHLPPLTLLRAAAAAAIENRTISSTVDLIPLTSFQCYLPSLPCSIVRQTLPPYRLARIQSKLSDNSVSTLYASLASCGINYSLWKIENVKFSIILSLYNARFVVNASEFTRIIDMHYKLLR